ncbi:MAG: DUF6494 family protein [Chromatiales bacterium]
MNEDTFNLEVRKFLKKVGVSSQRELERAVRESIAAGQLSGAERLAVTITLEVGGLGLRHTIADTIALE